MVQIRALGTEQGAEAVLVGRARRRGRSRGWGASYGLPSPDTCPAVCLVPQEVSRGKVPPVELGDCYQVGKTSGRERKTP